MKYSLMILALLMVVGISSADLIIVYDNEFYCGANTTYDWTLTKSADKSDLVFSVPGGGDDGPKDVVFTVDITRSAPYSQVYIQGKVHIYNNGSENATMDSVVISIFLRNISTGDTLLLKKQTYFMASYILKPESTFTIYYNIPFTTTGDITNSLAHYMLTSVYTDLGRFQSYYGRNYFHATPRVVNETLHVWDEYTVPSGFSASPTWVPAYDGTYWTTLYGSGTLYLTLAITNQSQSTPGTYVLKNYAYGINECGEWMDSVLISLHVEPPPDSEWEGYTYTPGFWKSPNGRRIFVDYLPVTIAGVTVPTVDSGVVILNRNRKSSSAWQKFLAFFLAMTFNYMTDESLLEAYYNDKSTDGEFMEGELVADIIDLADTYRSNTPEATLMAMKHVFDQMCNNSEHTVLWLNGDGGAGKTASLSTGNFITLNPNPFNNRTEIRFLTENKEPITLSVYDIKGAKVRDLVKTANSTLYWDGTDNNGRKLNRGIYIILIHNTALKALISR